MLGWYACSPFAFCVLIHRPHYSITIFLWSFSPCRRLDSGTYSTGTIHNYNNLECGVRGGWTDRVWTSVGTSFAPNTRWWWEHHDIVAPLQYHHRHSAACCKFYLTQQTYRQHQNFNMEAVQTLPAHQQQEFMKHLEEMQLKDSLTWVFFLLFFPFLRYLYLCFDSLVGESLIASPPFCLLACLLILYALPRFDLECTIPWSHVALMVASVRSAPKQWTSRKQPARKIALVDTSRWHNALGCDLLSIKLCNRKRLLMRLLLLRDECKKTAMNPTRAYRYEWK